MKASLKILIFLIITMNPVLATLQQANKLFDKLGQPGAHETKSHRLIAEKLYGKKLYFSSAHFARLHLLKRDSTKAKEFDDILEKLILRTGTIPFVDLPYDVLKSSPHSSLLFILGLKYFQKNRYQEAIQTLTKLGERHRFSPEALLMMGTAQTVQSRYKDAVTTYRNCTLSSQNFADQSKDQRLKRYYTILKESCVIHQARLEYKRGEFKLAKKMYEQIPTKSYRWPYIILEQAWTAYVNEDYNRTLGLLVTYKSPLLESYFMPEAAVLRSLSYLKLCLWQDSLQVINEYYNQYKAKSDALKAIIMPHKSSHTYFLNLVNSKLDKSEFKNPFIRSLATQTKKKIKYNIELHQYKDLKKEQAKLKKYFKQKKSRLLVYLRSRLNQERNWRLKRLNHFVKKEMFSFLNEMHQNSYEMVNIKLEILFLQRDLLYDNKKLASKRARGSSTNVKRAGHQHFYTFKGAFWADELGDYSFGLESNCKKVKR
jgi:tetratricopeptide (TPR) repeat protein